MMNGFEEKVDMYMLLRVHASIVQLYIIDIHVQGIWGYIESVW